MATMKLKKVLSSFNSLTEKITVYVPATQDVNSDCDNSAVVAETAALLSALFGGATALQAKGYWVSEETGLVEESTTPVYANCSEEQLESGIERVIAHCQTIKTDMHQECVGLEVNGRMYFI